MNKERRREYDQNYYKNHVDRKKKSFKAYYRKNKDKIRDVQLQRKFGISAELYDEMLKAQGGCCALCCRPVNGNRRLAVDHRHVPDYEKLSAKEKRRHVRGLLCAGCNIFLGQFGDDLEAVRDALENWQSNIFHYLNP